MVNKRLETGNSGNSVICQMHDWFGSQASKITWKGEKGTVNGIFKGELASLWLRRQLILVPFPRVKRYPHPSLGKFLLKPKKLGWKKAVGLMCGRGKRKIYSLHQEISSYNQVL